MKKLKIISLVGARPQFIKAAAISRSVREDYAEMIEEVLVHSGQHYDDNMSRVFFQEMEIPGPKHNMGVGSGSHGRMTASIISGFEEILEQERPDAVIVYGDTNTTIAGAIATSKMHIPVAHIEAGLRSFSKSMPEEINRVLCDHVSSYLFTPTPTGLRNLVREGFDPSALAPYSIDNPKVDHCGDVMYDNALYYLPKAEKSSTIMKSAGLEEDFILCTIHRDSNTDSALRLNEIFRALDEISEMIRKPVFIPLHPRTRKMMPQVLDAELMEQLRKNPMILLGGPVSYFDMLVLENRAGIIITDSGGVQKEAYFFKKPCLILRPESEWKEIIDQGAAVIVDADRQMIIAAARQFADSPPAEFPPIFGEGHSARHILGELIKNLKDQSA